MNAVVETTEEQKTFTITKHRVTLNLDDIEAVILKTALEYLRNPTTWTDEALTVREYESAELDEIIAVFESAGIYVDGLDTD